MARNLKILHFPSNNLTHHSLEITDFTSVLSLVNELQVELYKSDSAVGLAAPQVGINLCVAVIDPSVLANRIPTSDSRILINPRVTSVSQEMISGIESCLSFPNLAINVKRHLWVDVSYQNLGSECIIERFVGWSARVVQHEIDHLNGVTILDYAPATIKKAYVRSLQYETK